MRAVQLTRFRAPLEEVRLPDPDPGPGEVLIHVRAAGICHSDAHYRSGLGTIALPRTPGHEVSGVVARCGPGVVSPAIGSRVAVHYLVSCGTCDRCRGAGEQFCRTGAMIGKERDGGYAEAIVVPAENAVPLPEGVSFEHAAVMMCSTATAFHALRLASLSPGEIVAIIGFGGLGASALQLAGVLGAGRVVVLDVVAEKLAQAGRLGATAIDPRVENLEDVLLRATDRHGIDVALDFAGQPATTSAVLRSLAPRGRLTMVALATATPAINPYRDLVAKEASVIGCSDHLRSELVELLDLAGRGALDLSSAIAETLPLDATAINAALDDLEAGTPSLRRVILP